MEKGDLKNQLERNEVPAMDLWYTISYADYVFKSSRRFAFYNELLRVLVVD